MNLLIIPLFARGERKTHAIFMQFSDLQFLEEWIKSEKKKKSKLELELDTY